LENFSIKDLVNDKCESNEKSEDSIPVVKPKAKDYQAHSSNEQVNDKDV